MTTEKLCGSSLPYKFSADIWETGEFSVKPTDGRFRTVSFTYPRLKEGCAAYAVNDVKQYNFGMDGKDDWAQFNEINSLDDLNNINKNHHTNYVLMTDIDLDRGTFSPIVPNSTFWGNFSGDGHTIKGDIDGNKPRNDDFTALFSNNSGLIMNLAVKCDVSGGQIVGGICGINYGTIYGCSFEGNVTGKDYVGGICGRMPGGYSHIINCYAIGTIEATNTYAGGISGYSEGANSGGHWDFVAPSIKNCYFVGIVTVPDSGKKDAITVKTSDTTKELTVENCYYNKDIYTGGTSYGTGLTTVEMTSSGALTTMGLDTSIWEKKANTVVDSDGENGAAYYPSLKESAHVPSEKFTASLTFERTDNKKLTYLDKFEIRYGGELKFANGVTIKLDNTNCELSASDDVDDSYLYIVDFDSVTSDTFVTTVASAGEITYTFKCPPRTNSNVSELLPSEGLTKSFSIDAAKYTLSADDFEVELPTDPVYNGKPWNSTAKIKGNTPLAMYKGCGDITLKYYDMTTGEEAEPINAGKYLVKLDVSESENCYAATDLTADGNIWSFTIEQAEYYPAPVNVAYNWATTGEHFVYVDYPADMGTISEIHDAEISCDASVISNARYEDGKVYFTFSDANTEQDIKKMALIECKIDSQNYQTITTKVYVTLSGLENQEAPSADKFDLVLKNNGSDITAEIKTELTGVEFSFDGVLWSTRFSTPAQHDELIVGFIRYAATSTHNASAPSFKKVRSGHGDISANHYDRVEPSCVDDGSIEYWECTQCHKKFSDAEGLNEVSTVVLAALGHKLSAAVEENRVEATCVVDGSYDEVVYCSVCNKELSRDTKAIPAKGHAWVTEWSTDEHDHWHKCENCDAINDKAAHVSSGAATETTPETCTVCRYVISPELGHIHANHLTEVPAKAPTCIEDGNKAYFRCECGKLFTDSTAATKTTLADVTIKAEGHKFGDWATTKEPTYTTTGIKTRTCSACGATEEDTIPKKSGGSSSGGSSGGSSRPSTPTDTKPAINGSQKSWADISADVAKLPAGSSATISTNGETNVPADVIRSIKDSKANVEFVIDSTRSWIVDGSKITSASAADFSILQGNADKSALRGVIGADIKIKDTGVPADLKLTFRREFAGQFANVHKLTDGKLVFQNCVKVDENGIATVSGVNTNGEYVVMVCKFSDRPGDMNNDGILNALDASSVLKDIVGIADGENPLMGDYNGDGVVNALDAAAILKAIVGIAA